jgi:hypothetical protein
MRPSALSQSTTARSTRSHGERWSFANMVNLHKRGKAPHVVLDSETDFLASRYAGG